MSATRVMTDRGAERDIIREGSTSMEKENMILGVIRGREDMLGNQGTDQRGSVSQLVYSEDDELKQHHRGRKFRTSSQVSDGDASLTMRKGATSSVREQEESPMGNRRVRSILFTESKTERSADDMNAAIGSQSKFRNLSMSGNQSMNGSISPRRGALKSPTISFKRSVGRSPVHQNCSRSPVHPVQSSRSVSPTRQSISISPRGRSPSSSPSRSASRSPLASLSRSRSRNTSPANARTRSVSRTSGRPLPRRSLSRTPEISPVQTSVSRSPPVIWRRSISPVRSVSRSPVRRSGRRPSQCAPRVSRRNLRSSPVRSSRRSFGQSLTWWCRSRRSISRSASPARRAISPSSDHGRSPSWSGCPDGSPKRIRRWRGFTHQYSFARKYLSPTPDHSPVRSRHYGGRSDLYRYASYRSSPYHRRYRSSPRGRASPRYRSRSRSISRGRADYRDKGRGSRNKKSPVHHLSPSAERSGSYGDRKHVFRISEPF